MSRSALHILETGSLHDDATRCILPKSAQLALKSSFFEEGLLDGTASPEGLLDGTSSLQGSLLSSRNLNSMSPRRSTLETTGLMIEARAALDRSVVLAIGKHGVDSSGDGRMDSIDHDGFIAMVEALRILTLTLILNPNP